MSNVVIILAITLARAGGGQGYSGGGGGGGGFGGGSSGGGDGDGGFLIYLLIRLIFEYPAVGIPLTLIVIGFFVYAGYKGNDVRKSSVIRRGVAAEDVSRQPEYVAAIRRNDPAFDAPILLDRVRRAFVKIQYAWSKQDLSDVRPFISDAVYERFSLQFDEQRLLGYRNEMRDVVVRRAHIAHAASGNVFDEISIRIEASAADRNVDLHTGQPIRGSDASGDFIEVWSFLRRRGAKTHPEKPGLMEGNCPNCGGPIEMNQAANCGYCGALLRSGQYDWVLAEITQQYEWEPRHTRDVAGLMTLRQRDPDFNEQEIEDRTSVIFWRLAAAERSRSAEPLRKVALTSFADDFAAAMQSRQEENHSYQGERAVGSVTLRGIVPAGVEAGQVTAVARDMDLALVLVRWQGHSFTQRRGQLPKRGAKSSVVNTLFVLARSATAKTNADLSIASAHCPSCGSPEVGGSGGSCQHCGTPLNQGDQQWALAEVTPANSPRGSELLALTPESRTVADGRQMQVDTPGESWLGDFDHLTGSSAASTMQWMVHMTTADGHVDPQEREILRAAAVRYGIPKQRLEEYVLAAEGGNLDLTPPASEGEARRHLADMARTALADGKVTPGERKILMKAGKQLGLGDADINLLLARVRGDMFREARQVLRRQKSRQG